MEELIESLVTLINTIGNTVVVIAESVESIKEQLADF